MRAGRLPEILCNEDIIVVGAGGSTAQTKEFRSTWKLIEFAHNFPFTEVVKISPEGKNKLIVYVYDATAKALAEKRFADVLKYAELFENHAFSDDIEYIEKSRESRERRCREKIEELTNQYCRLSIDMLKEISEPIAVEETRKPDDGEDVLVAFHTREYRFGHVKEPEFLLRKGFYLGGKFHEYAEYDTKGDIVYWMKMPKEKSKL